MTDQNYFKKGISEINESGGTSESHLPNCSLAATWQINCDLLQLRGGEGGTHPCKQKSTDYL